MRVRVFFVFFVFFVFVCLCVFVCVYIACRFVCACALCESVRASELRRREQGKGAKGGQVGTISPVFQPEVVVPTRSSVCSISFTASPRTRAPAKGVVQSLRVTLRAKASATRQEEERGQGS